MTDSFFAFLTSMEPEAAGGRILSTDAFREWSVHFAEGQLFRDMKALLERRLPALDGGEKRAVADADKEVLRQFLEGYPQDYFANLIRRQGESKPERLLGEKAEEAYLGYLEACLDAADRLGADQEVHRYYADAIRRIDPDHPALALPATCEPGERRSDPADPLGFVTCSAMDVTLNGEESTGVVWLPEPLDEGHGVPIDGHGLVWSSKLRGWLPASPREGDTLLQKLPDGPLELVYVEGPDSRPGTWMAVIEPAGNVRGGGSPCPTGTGLVAASRLEHAESGLARLLYGLVRQRIEWLLVAEGPDLGLVSLVDPKKRLSPRSKKARRLLSGTGVATLCAIAGK